MTNPHSRPLQGTNVMKRMVKLIIARIGKIFEPEEVVVELKTDGDKVTYTYTKVDRKQAA